MSSLPQTLAPWHDFYMLLGEASATMTALLFVAASIGSGVFSQSRRGALRMFLSASVVQFGCILSTSLIVLAPIERWQQVGGLILACGGDVVFCMACDHAGFAAGAAVQVHYHSPLVRHSFAFRFSA